MAHQWQGVLREYADRLDVTEATPVVTLGEGGTPLIPARALSERTGAQVYVKYEGMNPTGSFKDRGMTMAISKAVEHGAKAVICASTGNTSASAAAYATHAGITAAVLVPEGKIAMGKLSQAIAHNAQLLQVQGNFDDCLDIARDLAANYPVHLVNSVNPDRIEGQKTAAFEVVEVLGDAPDFHFIPVGNAGNYTAYHRGYREELARGASQTLPRMFGFQAAGSAPIVVGEPVRNPETIASAIRIGNPASWELALTARDDSDGYFGAIDDAKILEAHRILSAEVGIFVEPASAISVAGLLERAEAGVIPKGARVVLTVTGHGLKDPQWALRAADGSDVTPTSVPVDTAEIAGVLGLSGAA
ncbi:threonine synthase [Herbiconiux sp. L3-i23]|uniref:threonine synthase n=1 Tax=Herbiconiux sp. L3-i23 TaxID=2905871 RepID=UPI0020640A75|nr:threonine synthase [Herbiconiux sp. L3-i23]BDI21996.1 threonine synthase [Herbiconiux sp. L3-i23]